MTKQSKGITLVALIVTIIILLILVGISIASLTGNGLFEKAKLAKEKQENAQIEEEAKLGDYENKIGQYIDGSNRNNGETELGNINKLLDAEWTNTSGESTLASITPTIYDSMQQYFSYEQSTGKLTCKKSGWYLFDFTVSTYNPNAALSKIKTYIKIDGISILANTAQGLNISQEETNTNTVNLYIKQNSVVTIENVISNSMSETINDFSLYSL